MMHRTSCSSTVASALLAAPVGTRLANEKSMRPLSGTKEKNSSRLSLHCGYTEVLAAGLRRLPPGSHTCGHDLRRSPCPTKRTLVLRLTIPVPVERCRQDRTTPPCRYHDDHALSSSHQPISTTHVRNPHSGLDQGILSPLSDHFAPCGPLVSIDSPPALCALWAASLH